MNIDYQKASEIIERHAGLSSINTVNKKQKPPYQIRWKGNIIKLGNGKCIWPTIGAAKNALRGKIDENHMVLNSYIGPILQENILNSSGGRIYLKHSFKEQCYQTILQELQNQGILIFEPLI